MRAFVPRARSAGRGTCSVRWKPWRVGRTAPKHNI